MKETMLKVLTADMQSPTSSTPIKYELGRLYTCKDFDPDPDNDCSRGFYATNVEGLPYTFKAERCHRVFQVEVSGKNVNYNIYKRRWENIKLIKEISYDEVRQMAVKHRAICGYRLDEVLFPIDPKNIISKANKNDWSNLDIFTSINKDALEAAWSAAWDAARNAAQGAALLAAWNATRDAAWSAARNAARYVAARNAARSAAWSAAWDAARNATQSYVMSVFPCLIKIKDKNILNAIEAGSQLWRRGFLPIVVNGEWKLLSAHNNKILEREEL